VCVQQLFGAFGVPPNRGVDCLARSSIRVLVVDDFEPFRRLLCSTLHNKLELQTIVEASNGMDAIELAQILQPDLILLDIALPKVDGIEVARRIRELAPQSKILFVSQESSAEVVQAAFNAGASGYVVKMDVGGELPIAVRTVLRGEKFVGSRFAGCGGTGAPGQQPPRREGGNKLIKMPQRQDRESTHRHEAGFYSDDTSLLDGFTRFVERALKAGDAAVVVATEAHRDRLLVKLQTLGLDMAGASEQGRYVSLDAFETLSTFMDNGIPDPLRLRRVVGDLILNAAKTSKAGQSRVVVCGECAPLLWAQGEGEAAMELENLWGDIAKSQNVDLFCGYLLGSFRGAMGRQIFDKLCAAHSVVHSR
jgi:DNA-binding NarL/FixJ family response regulator